MINISEKLHDTLHVVTGLLWIFLAVAFGLSKSGFGPLLMKAAFIASVAIIVIYFIMGTSVNNKIGIKIPLVYPILIMAVLWLIAFFVAVGTKESTGYFILGMQTGWFTVTLCFWIGTFLTSTLSYHLFFDKYYLSDEDWNNFLEEVKKVKKG